MTKLRAWAPSASRVEIVVGHERRPLEGAPEGWWTGTWSDLAPGSDYAFSLDGGPPLPDP